MSRLRALALGAALALCACAEPQIGDSPKTLGMTGIRFLAEGDAGGFSRAAVAREFSFPADHASHPDFRTEWWYFTGNLFAGGGRHFGFELTFFRLGLSRVAPERESAWSTNEIWLAHFAVTDTEHGRFIASERLSRGAIGLAGISATPFRLWVKDWSAEGGLDGSGSALRLAADTPEVGLELFLEGFDRVVAQGERGLDRKGPEAGNASYYYSAPRLNATGTIRIGESAASQVAGTAWLDREWGTSALSDGIAGWDWFALQLDDGRDLMFYRLRRADGSASEFSSGSLSDTAGPARSLDANDVELRVLEQWRSPISGVSYPIAWNLRIASEDLELEISPRLRDQELRLSVRYWEGAVIASGRDARGPVNGVGYLELAGY